MCLLRHRGNEEKIISEGKNFFFYLTSQTHHMIEQDHVGSSNIWGGSHDRGPQKSGA